MTNLATGITDGQGLTIFARDEQEARRRKCRKMVLTTHSSGYQHLLLEKKFADHDDAS